MKRPFWVKGNTRWQTIRYNAYLLGCIILSGLLFLVGVVLAVGVLYCVCYKVPSIIIKSGRELGATSDKRKAERDESFKMEYAGKEFYKFNLEGHEYWYVEGLNPAGFCHSESCPCKTNKVEVMK